MEYLHRIEEIKGDDILWNVPEQKQGEINVIGGNAQSFRIPMKIAEYLGVHYPLKTLHLVLPDALRPKLPEIDSLLFLSSTDSGSLANGDELTIILNSADYNLLIGDLSKNTITAKAVQEACLSSDRPILVTRDTVDLLADEQAGRILMNDNLIIMGSLVQIQKIFRSVYYPKMIMMSQSMVQVAEAIHKFTLSYPARIITMHDNQVLVAENGIVNVVSLEKINYSPITLWGGELAARIVALNLYNPGKFLETTTVALFTR